MIKSINKSSGAVYTPNYLVKNILDLFEYKENRILKKHIIDNSCGDGAFLKEIVKRYCEVSIENNTDKEQIKTELETYIHGIDIDNEAVNSCIDNLNNICLNYNIKNVKWNIICKDTLTVNDYNGRMDYVVGNPPYVRVHNLGEKYNEVKNFEFSQDGMTDLYLVFFEIGLKMLNENGELAYITPSSYFNSVAGDKTRKYFVENHLLNKVVNLKHYQAFENYNTYTAITILKKEQKEEIEYYEYDECALKPIYVDTLCLNDYYIYGKFLFGKKEYTEIVKRILSNDKKSNIEVKNGYQTSCDKVFIKDFDFESEYIIPCVKASTGQESKIFYPYDDRANPIPIEKIKEDEALYEYLLKNKEVLINRDNENDTESGWYLFGRSQSLIDTYKDRLTVSNIIRDKKDLKFWFIGKGMGVYSGLYVLSGTVPYNEIVVAIQSDEFILYVKMLGKYKSGGYYNFSSNDLKKYLDYKFWNYNLNEKEKENKEVVKVRLFD